jgi:hypothetical protein
VLKREDYEDYRPVDGMKIPFAMSGIDQNEVPFIIKYTQIKHNVPIDDAQFDKPKPKTAAESNPSAAPMSPVNRPSEG